MEKQTFTKTERLKSHSIIQRIFKREGQSFAVYPIRVIWLETPLETAFPVQVAFSVPKRQFKKAVDRNRIKRLMREAYRLNKSKFYASVAAQEKQIAVLFIYTNKEIMTYDNVSEAMQKVLKRLRRSL
jgi:ribonuclease P protein component